MKRQDRINPLLPDELILEIFHYLHSKSSRDACSLVCKRWLQLERMSRETIRVGASNNPDALVRLLGCRFINVKNVYIDERLSISRPVQYGRRRGGNPAGVPSTNLQQMTQKKGSKDGETVSQCLSDAGLAVLGVSFMKLEKLSLIWCSNVTSAGLKFVAEKSSSLTTLDLQGCYVGDQGLAAVGDCCKQLEDLNLRFCEGLTDSGLVHLAMGCGDSLKSLGIAACAKVTDVSLEAVASYCRSLETLSLDSEFIDNKGVIAVAKGCRRLKVLKLQCINVTDEALQAVGTFCLLLELLALYSFQRFTDMSLFAIGKGCKKLKNLILSDCYFLSDKGLEAVAAGCPELAHLEVNGCHNIGTCGLEFVGRSCKQLSELALLYCQKIGNCALTEVGRGCKYLQALHLVDCSSIGDDAIYNIAKGCRNLKKLHIRRCYEEKHAGRVRGTVHVRGITNEGLFEDGRAFDMTVLPSYDDKINSYLNDLVGNKGIIAVGENCKYLTELSLRFCDRVGDKALIAIAQGCSLQHLNVSGCHHIGDAGIIAIARGSPDLTYLDVSVLQNLGDMAMAELGEGCPLLKDIVLSHCRKVTDVGVSHLVKRCSLLKTCHMVYCPGITKAGVATVISSCANIKNVLVEKWKVSSRTKRRAGSIISYLCVDL